MMIFCEWLVEGVNVLSFMETILRVLYNYRMSPNYYVIYVIQSSLLYNRSPLSFLFLRQL